MKNLYNWFIAGLLIVFVVSCDVHQFPEQYIEPEQPDKPDDPVVPDDPNLYVDIDIELIYETGIYLWEHYYDPKIAMVVEQYPDANVDGKHPATTQFIEGRLDYGKKHTVVQFYQKGNTSNVLKSFDFVSTLEAENLYDEKFGIRMMPGDYDVVVWTDFMEADDTPSYYDASDFNSIKIDYDNYAANTDHRDSFRGRKLSVNVSDIYQNHVVVELARPMAKYEFVTTDLSEFLDKETERRNLSTRASMDDYDVKIFYSTYHPSAYSAVDDILRDSSTGVSFETEVTITGESEASLGFDYVFINDVKDAAVQATIVVYDKSGEIAAQSVQITVPLRRDHHTLLRGAFLTMNGSGGVGIDPGYNGDHNVIP